MPEVESEVVPGAGRDDHERESVSARDRGHQRLRAISAGHADQVGAGRDHRLGELQQVVTGKQHDGFDPGLQAAIRECEALGLAAPRSRVDQQHRVLRRCGGVRGRVRAPGPQRVAGRADRGGSEHQSDQQHPDALAGHHDDDERDHRDDGDRGADDSGHPASRHDVPGRQDEHRDGRDRRHQHDPARQGGDHQEDDEGHPREQGQDRGEPPGGGNRCAMSHGHCSAPLRCHVAPVCRMYSATAASTVGKKWAGSIVRVSS